MSLHCLLLVCLFIISIPYQLLAEDEKIKPEQLEDVSITAARVERSTDEVPAAVTTVTKEQIKANRMFSLKEALSGIAGVQSETRNGGYDQRLIIRGAGLKARYGVREIMVLVDGVPITDPDGLTRLDSVDSQMVERIEVVKGPGSTLYGANAAGGVVNIITKSPYEEIKSFKLGYGNNETKMYNLIYGNHVGDTYFTLSGSRRSTDSWREWNKFTTQQGGIKLGHLVDNRTSIEATLNYNEADTQLPGALTETQYEDDITQLTSDAWRHMGRYSKVWFTNIRATKEVGSLKFKPVLYFQQWKHYHPVTGLINDGGAKVYGADFQTDINHTLAGMQGTLTLGVTGQIDKADGKKYKYKDFTTGFGGRIIHTLSDDKGGLAEDSEDTTTKHGVYIQESLRPSDAWIVDLGVRYDQVTFDIDTEVFSEYNYGRGKYTNRRETIERNEKFEFISPKIGVVYKPTNSLSPYATFSGGFQTPQSSEIGITAELDPMRVYNYETGLKGRFAGGHSFNLALFYMRLKDEIVQVIEPGFVSAYTNAGQTTKKGLELDGRLQILEDLFLGGAYTYSDFRFDEFNEPIRGVNFDRSGNRLPYIPKHQYSLFASYKHASGLKFRLDTNSWGEYYVDNANSEKYHGYDFITNIMAGYERGNWDVTLTVYNVFDKKYAMEVTKDSEILKYRPGAPITWLASVSYRF